MPSARISELTVAASVGATDQFEINTAGGAPSRRADLSIPWTFTGLLTVSSFVATTATVSGAVTLSSLTSGRIPYASTGGLLADSVDLAFSGSTLTAHTLTVSTGNLTVSTGTIGLSTDVLLARDAANILAQRNGTSAQAFRLYNTFTDASNYEHGGLIWDTNTLVVSTANGGTGTARGINIQAAGSFIDFSTSSAARWEINSTGFVAFADNTYDIGASGANRPRTGYFGTSLVVGSAGWTMSATAATGLTAQGNARFVHGTSALATTATEGFLHIQSCAGAPTGVPASIPTGQIPMVYDSTNNRLYLYDGGWLSVAVA